MTEHHRGLAGIEGDRLVGLFDALPAFVAVLRGPEHVFAYANDHYMQMVGHGRNIVGLPVPEALPEIKNQGFMELLDNVLATGEPFYGKEMPAMLDRQGNGSPEEIYVDFVYLPTRSPEGEIDGILAHGVEVTEQVRAREKLEDLARELAIQRASLATVIERMPVGVVLCDASGKITTGNTVWRDFYGVPLDGLNDVSSWDVFEGTRPDGSVYEPQEYPLARSILHGEIALGEPIDFRSAQTGEVRVLVGGQHRQQRGNPLRLDAWAVIVAPDMDVERTGQGMGASPDLRQVRQLRYHVAKQNAVRRLRLARRVHNGAQWQLG